MENMRGGKGVGSFGSTKMNPPLMFGGEHYFPNNLTHFKGVFSSPQ